MIIKERNLGYTSSAQSVWNELYVDPDTDKIYDTYLTDNVDIYLFNTRKLYDEIKNKRRKSYSVVYEALLSLFQTNVDDYLYPKKVMVTSEMVQSWFKKHNADFKEILKPVVDKVDEYRQEIFGEGVTLKEVKSKYANKADEICDYAKKNIKNKDYIDVNEIYVADMVDEDEPMIIIPFLGSLRDLEKVNFDDTIDDCEFILMYFADEDTYSLICKSFDGDFDFDIKRQSSLEDCIAKLNKFMENPEENFKIYDLEIV